MKLKRFVTYNNSSLIFIATMIASIAVMGIVYLTGGTNKVYAHLMYMPIAVAASTYGKRLGVLNALFGGILIGPFMPLNVQDHISQQPVNWIMRVIIFVVIALIIGAFSDYGRQSTERITQLLTHNENTGLKNIEAIKREKAVDGIPKTIVIFSIKGFRETMSLFGYNFENQITQKIAEKLNEIVKLYDSAELYQYYGMQFLLKIKNNHGTEDADEIISLIKELDKSILVVENIPVYLEVRMGISEISGKIAVFEGLRRALVAYSYSQANGTKSIKFKSEIEEYYQNIFDVAGGFSGAIAEQKIGAAYQEIVCAKSEKTYCVEILARWEKENGIFISPELFVPIVEKTELMQELTKYIISRAMELLKIHQEDEWVVSINFSCKDFTYESIEHLISAIKEAGVNPERVQIEIIERTIADVKDMERYLKLLRNHKIKIALDDFGTGYSSYHYLSELPLDTIKIDRSLIFKIDKSDTSRSLIESFVKFCIENKIKTVAEGVETKEIADVCKQIGIDYLQGFYYHRPEMMKTPDLISQVEA